MVFFLGADLILRDRRLQIRVAVLKKNGGSFSLTLSEWIPIVAHLKWIKTDEEVPTMPPVMMAPAFPHLSNP